MANVFYDNGKKNLLNGNVVLPTHNIYVMLVDNSYTPNQTSHEFRSSISGEVTGTGYTAGGMALTTKAVTADTTNHRGKFTADNATWSTATITAYGAVLYRSRGGASSADELIGYIDFGGAVSSSAGILYI